MIVALTGASGFIGAAIAHRLAEAGHRVVALVRPTSSRSHLDSSVYRYAIGDHADPDSCEDLLKNVDALVHNSFDWKAVKSDDLSRHLHSNLDSSLLLLDLAHRLGVNRVVYMSSVAVHHEISDRWEGMVDEDHPLRPHGLYGACKAAVEAHLWAAHHSWGMHTVSLRPSAVYGVEPIHLKRSHGYTQINRLLRGGDVTPKKFPGGGKWVHVDDVAEATLQAIERDQAAGKAFNLADCYAKFTQLGQFAAEHLGLPPERAILDTSPPARNQFDKTQTRQILGVNLDRGLAGLKEHMGRLVEKMKESAQHGKK